MTLLAKDCEEARLLLRDEQRGRLPEAQSAAVRRHLRGCAACSHLDAEERVLDELLHAHLPPIAAPQRLRERLANQLATPAPAARRPTHRAPLIASGAAGALALLAACFLLWPRGHVAAPDPLLHEAVNDHLRVLYAQKPIEIESGGIHQVKPWFTGRVDFAPDLTFSGDADFPMVGGAVGYLIDRKTATLVFKRRLHTISLFVFRSEGLPWPRSETRTLGALSAQVGEVAGFHAVMWRGSGLGHVLVSDAGVKELLELGRRIVETH
jgi:anti-sigma factor RsiW